MLLVLPGDALLNLEIFEFFSGDFRFVIGDSLLFSLKGEEMVFLICDVLLFFSFSDVKSLDCDVLDVFFDFEFFSFSIEDLFNFVSPLFSEDVFDEFEFSIDDLFDFVSFLFSEDEFDEFEFSIDDLFDFVSFLFLEYFFDEFEFF